MGSEKFVSFSLCSFVMVNTTEHDDDRFKSDLFGTNLQLGKWEKSSSTLTYQTKWRKTHDMLPLMPSASCNSLCFVAANVDIVAFSFCRSPIVGRPCVLSAWFSTSHSTRPFSTEDTPMLRTVKVARTTRFARHRNGKDKTQNKRIEWNERFLRFMVEYNNNLDVSHSTSF